MQPIYLNKEVDKTGVELEILHVEKIANSPVYTFFIRHMAELIDSGFAMARTSWNDDECGAIYAEENGVIVGAIIYSRAYLHKNCLWIELSAVRDDCRKRGIYSVLHNYFEMLAKKMNCDSISSKVHKNNLVRLSSAEKVGMNIAFYQMVKMI